MSYFEIVTPPAQKPVTLAEVSAYLRLADETSENTLLENIFIPAITSIVQDMIGLALIKQTLRFTRTNFTDKLDFPLAQVVEDSVAIEYKNTSGSWVIWDSSNYIYERNKVGGVISLSANGTYPSDKTAEANSIRIEYEAGFGEEPTDIPTQYKLLIFALVAHLWEKRGTMTTFSLTDIKTTLKYLIQGYSRLNF